MNFSDYLTNAVRRVNRLWPLVLVEVLAVALNLVLLVLLLGIPIVIAILVFGLPLAQLMDEGARSMREIGAGHVWAAVGFIALVGIFAIAYLAIAIVVQCFARAAVLGVIADDTAGVGSGFSVSGLIDAGKRHFRRVLYYTILTTSVALAGILALVIAIVLSVVVYEAMGEGSTGATVFAVACGVTLAGLTLVLLFLWMVIYTQGFAPLLMRPAGARESIRMSVNFLENMKGALGFVLLLFLALIVIQAGLGMLGMAIQMIPVLGALIYIPYSLFSNVVAVYTGLCLMAGVMEYYYLNELWPEQFEAEALMDQEASIFEESSGPSDTYPG